MEISTKQILVLDYIKEFIASHGYSPTVREICVGLGLKSPSTVHEHLKKLVSKGIITINPTKSRTIELLVENEYQTIDKSIAKVPIITEEFLEDLSREFLNVPNFMLNGYDIKNICAFKENEKTIYLINKSLKPLEGNKTLNYINNKLKIDSSTENIIGTVISKYETY